MFYISKTKLESLYLFHVIFITSYYITVLDQKIYMFKYYLTNFKQIFHIDMPFSHVKT